MPTTQHLGDHMRFPLLIMLALTLLCAPVFASNLSITDLHVSVSYPAPYDRFSDTREDNEQDLVDGADISVDIYPGSVVEFVFEVANLFDSDDDIDIEDITVTLTVEELDDGSDVEVESETFDLGSEEEFKPRMTLSIPEKVEDKEYLVTLEAEGETNNDTTETVENTYTITVKKDSHDLKLTRVTVSPNSVSCDREIRASATITNVGRLLEDNAAVEISSAPLGLYALKSDIELSEDPFLDENDFIYAVPFTIPQSVAAGTYDVTFKAIYEETLALHVLTVPVTVLPCGVQKPVEIVVANVTEEEPASEESQTPSSSEEQTTTESTAVTETSVPSTTESAPVITSSVEKSATSRNGFKTVFILVNVLVLAVIIAIASLLISRRKQ